MSKLILGNIGNAFFAVGLFHLGQEYPHARAVVPLHKNQREIAEESIGNLYYNFEAELIIHGYDKPLLGHKR